MIFTNAKTIYDHLKPTLRDFNPDLFIVHVGTNDLSFNETISEIVKIVYLADSVKKASSNIVISSIVTRD